ncbi:hypothetical protein P0136_04835 [Lentisphaerota bacterium ZTH]|nr:hypothetical protein JYG24_04045 [Lentisphaerota bacterium]WET07315.1 hypothetical protein P0136_04835 [Lentisphaerota bacterium ZTH]
MISIGLLSSEVSEIKNRLEQIFQENSKFALSHVRYTVENGFYFHNSWGGFGKTAARNREQKRRAAKIKLFEYFQNKFPELYSRHFNYFRFNAFTRALNSFCAGETITGRGFQQACQEYLNRRQTVTRAFRNSFGNILARVKLLYDNSDVMLFGHRHDIRECRGHSFLKDFLLRLRNVNHIDTSRNHIIFFELLMSLHSHYQRRRISNYNPESSYHFEYDQNYENPNSMRRHMDFLAGLQGENSAILRDKTSWFLNNLENVYFFDDSLTSGIMSPPEQEKISHDSLFSYELLSRDMETVKRLHGISRLDFGRKERHLIKKNGSTVNYELRQKNNIIIGRRMLNDICRFRKTFIVIGSKHLYGGNGVMPMQNYIKKHLPDKRLTVIEFVENDEPNFEKTGRHFIDARISWPTWMSGLEQP